MKLRVEGKASGIFGESTDSRTEGALNRASLGKRSCFVVVHDKRVAGIITPNEVRSVNRADWGRISVQRIMRPLNQLRTVPPDMPVVKALDLMTHENFNQLAVVSDGKLERIFSRGRVVRFLRVYSGLGEESKDLAV